MDHKGKKTLLEFFGYANVAPSARRGECFEVNAAGGGSLEASAKRSLSRLAEVLQHLRSSDRVVVATVYADAEAGRFPEILRNFFARGGFDYGQRYVVDGLRKVEPGESFAVPRLTFESDPRALCDVVSRGDGIVWASNLQVCGVVVPEADVARHLDLDLRNPEDVHRGEPGVVAAFKLDNDLLYLDVCAFAADAGLLGWLSNVWRDAETV